MDSWPTFAAIAHACGVDTVESASFEHEVHAASAVNGNPSCTDTMVLGGNRALAIEAKWTEPRYPSVIARLEPPKNMTNEGARQGETRRRKSFVQGWLTLMETYVGGSLGVDDFGECVYQVVHRAGSACGMGKPPALAYLHFSAPHEQRNSASSDDYRSDLAAVHARLGSPADFPFFVVDLPMQPTGAFKAISGLKKGARETGRAVRNALRNGVLFDFGEPTVVRIDSREEKHA